MLSWWSAHGLFWGGVCLLVAAAIVDFVHSGRRAREERQAAFRGLPVWRKRLPADRQAGRAGVPPTSESDERTGVSAITR